MKEVARDRVLDDAELAQVLVAARTMGGPYGGIVEFLALTGQRREEVAGLLWDEMDLAQQVWTIPKSKNEECQSTSGPPLDASAGRLDARRSKRAARFHPAGNQALPGLHSLAKRRLDQLSGVPDGAFMTYAGPACLGRLGWALAVYGWRRSSTTRLARSRELQLSTSATNFLRSAERLWTYGEPTLAIFLGREPPIGKGSLKSLPLESSRSTYETIELRTGV